MTRPARDLLDIQAAADYLGTSIRHVREMVYRRDITYLKIGRLVRFDRADLDRYLASRTVRARRPR